MVRIGARTGRAAPIFSMGHGMVMTPLAIIASQDAALTLAVVMDDPHLGEPGHALTVTEALTVLADMLKLADRGSAGAP